MISLPSNNPRFNGWTDVQDCTLKEYKVAVLPLFFYLFPEDPSVRKFL
uniref:Uncharacterized protein n=1 Tax=Anguilla anguilla TaxID=7936 RepID=A0A0E9W795_ANGAN